MPNPLPCFWPDIKRQYVGNKQTLFTVLDKSTILAEGNKNCGHNPVRNCCLFLMYSSRSCLHKTFSFALKLVEYFFTGISFPAKALCSGEEVQGHSSGYAYQAVPAGARSCSDGLSPVGLPLHKFCCPCASLDSEEPRPYCLQKAILPAGRRDSP